MEREKIQLLDESYLISFILILTILSNALPFFRISSSYHVSRDGARA